MNAKQKLKSVRRITAVFVMILVMFTGLFARLFYVQVISAEEYRQKQTAFIMKNFSIPAARGNIYDRNHTLLASDSTCSRIIVYPDKVTDPEGTAKTLSRMLNISYESVYKKVSMPDSSYEVIKREVDNITAAKIKALELNGVAVSGDKKRTYVNNSFAPYVMGFVGTDHTGLYGVELAYNDVLKGFDGVETVFVDGDERKIESTSNIKQNSIPGSSLVLTIDNMIQHWTQQIVNEYYDRSKAKRVLAIVTDVNTGEILAMASSDPYDLNDAWTIPNGFSKAFSSEMKNMTLGEKQMEMWKNPFTSYIYEPGSTFKAITVAAALEESIVTLDSNFNCSGYLSVSDTKIQCVVYPKSHGHETLTKAVVNSCNPAMIKIAQKMGPEKFSQYLNCFGFAQRTGVSLENEEKGLLSQSSFDNSVNFATLSFGQGIGVTPIQMIYALNTTINGGHLYSPLIVKSIVNTETGEVISENSPLEVRQVISEGTSEKMRGILKECAANISGLSGYKDLKLGGKSGTAQKFVNGSYAKNKNVASFYAFAPYDNPQISVMVIVDEPTGSATSGGRIAAPAAAEIIRQAQKYLNSDPISSTGKKNNAFIVPDLRGRTLEEAETALEGLNISYLTEGDENGIVVAQSNINAEYKDGMQVKIRISSYEQDTVIMPDLKGLSIQQAINLLESLGLEYESEGGGFVAEQSIAKDTRVKKGTKTKLVLKYIE